MAYRQYIGSRYVPIFGRKGEDTYEWDGGLAPYEPLTVVMHQGNSFTSVQYVPTGIDINNKRYWAETGNWNAQVESYRQTVLSFDGRITANTEASTANTEAISAEVTRATAAETANREAITAETTRASAAEEANANAIAAETVRATAAEEVNANAIAANTDAITAETTRATAAETTITENINKLRRDAIPNSINAMEGLFRFECNDKSYTNGGTRFTQNGVYYWVIAVGDNLCVFDENGTKLVTYTDAYIQHGQTLTYNDGFLYVTALTAFRKYNVSRSGITFVEQIAISGYPQIFDATMDDEYYYIYDDNGLHVVDRETQTEIISKTGVEMGVSNPGNGMFCWDDFNAICLNRFSTNNIVMLDKTTLEHVETITVYGNYGYLNMFEPEFAYADGEDIYIGVNNGYGFQIGDVCDIAPQTVMHTNIFKNNGMPATFSDVHPNQGYTDVKIINIDYQNSNPLPTLPNDFPSEITVKYPQDAAALLGALQQWTATYLYIKSECPICLALTNINTRILIRAFIPGIKLMGCNVTIEDVDNIITGNKSNWLLNYNQAGVYYFILTELCNVGLAVSGLNVLDDTHRLGYFTRSNIRCTTGTKDYCKSSMSGFITLENT